MAFDPSQPILVKVEISAGALGWVDVTSRGRKASCVIRQGMSANAIQAETSRLDLTLGNPDGYLTEDNAMSPWYPYWGRGCPIRVSRLGLTVSPAERFHGQVDAIEENYPGGGVDATVRVTAVGTLGILGRGSETLRSPLFRTMAGVAPGDYVPFVYWPMEDGADATQFASGLPGGSPVAFSAGVTPAAIAGPAGGSEPLATLAAGATLPIPIPAYSSTQIAFQWFMQIPSEPAAEMTLAEFYATSGPVRRWKLSIVPGTPSVVELRDYDASGTQINAIGILMSGSTATNPTEARFYGHWIAFLFAPQQTGADVTSWYSFTDAPPGGAPAAGNVDTGTLGQITRAVLYGGDNGCGIGHMGVYIDPAFVLGIGGAGPKANVAAMNGYDGETAADRMARLCFEESIGFTLTGTAADTVAMGPQLIDTLLNNLRDCATADQGLLHDNGTSGAVGYVTRANLYNQTATLAVANGSIEPNLQALRDFQYVRNDITSTRPNGGSAHVADETHVAKIGARIKDARNPNVETDDQLPNDAGWAVHIGTAPGARYNSVGINLRNADGAQLADAVAAHAIGDRFTVAATALPPQHDRNGIDGLTVGWTEYLDIDTWIFRTNLVPYSPYAVGVYDTARYDSDSTTLTADVTATATSVAYTVAAGSTGWVTTASNPSEFPFGITIGGEDMTVTAATGSTFTVTRSVNGVVKSHSAGAEIHVTDPGYYAL